MVTDSETDEMCPPTPNTKESKSTTATTTQPARQPPIQEMFMKREVTPGGLTDIIAKFQQKARETIQA